ncbi:dipeptidase PepV [Alicyclobacillus ferrooxydans]|nr:dipeptidase PepV [Alicyclobacillus ferrooxydans]
MLEGFIAEHRTRMVSTLQELLQIPSVEGAYVPGQPFGKDAADALKYVLNLASEFGFIVANVDGYAGHVEFGSGDEYVAVLSHLDVVPAGTNWTSPAFAAEIRDGRIYARGAIDDKGPALSTLWALIGLKQMGYTPKRKIRLVFGLDEESGWKCVEHYFAKQPLPLGGFTPDADFPLIHAEKGAATVRIEVPADDKSMNPRVLSFDGGERSNMVPDLATAIVDCHSETAASEWEQKLHKEARTRDYNVRLNVSGAHIEIAVSGTSAHGSTPDLGVNAITRLAVLLASQSVSNASMWRAISMLDTRGKSLGIDSSDEVTGHLTSNLGRAYLDEGKYVFLINIRYPIHKTSTELLSSIQQTMSDKWSIEIAGDKAPLYVPLDHPVVSVLSDVYQKLTGQPAVPLAIGGATYARAIPNAVAFGPLFPNQADLAHQADENWALDDYLRCIEIYAHAMLELANTL